jgi:hypothetical protein
MVDEAGASSRQRANPFLFSSVFNSGVTPEDSLISTLARYHITLR